MKASERGRTQGPRPSRRSPHSAVLLLRIISKAGRRGCHFPGFQGFSPRFTSTLKTLPADILGSVLELHFLPLKAGHFRTDILGWQHHDMLHSSRRTWEPRHVRSMWGVTPGSLCDPSKSPSLSASRFPHLNEKRMKLDGRFSNFKTLEPLL